MEGPYNNAYNTDLVDMGTKARSMVSKFLSI